MARRFPLSVLLLASACGAEPIIADAPAPPPPSVIAEEAPSPQQFGPSVMLSLPRDAALAQANVVIKLLFSTPMDTERTTPAFALLAANDHTVEGSLNWDTSAQVLAFRPGGELTLGEYLITLAESAADRAGARLIVPFIASFSVVADTGPQKAG